MTPKHRAIQFDHKAHRSFIKMRITVSFTLLSLSLLAACAGPVPKIDASTEKLAAIKTISVIRPPEPKTYDVMNFGHPGIAFGVIGGAIAASDQANKKNILNASYREKKLAINSKLADSIAERLNSSGYEAVVEEGPWEEVDGKFKLSFDKIASTADGVLVVTPTLEGFIATTTQDYMPTVAVGVILLGKDRKEQLYKGFHSSGWAPMAKGWRITPANVTFRNFDAIIQDTKASSEALANAAIAIGQTVSTDLEK